MDAQQIFDTVVRHLHQQGGPALEDGRCQYRTADGLKCAVGCLIPDEIDPYEVENLSDGCDSPRFRSWARDHGLIDLVVHSDLLADLQGAHDGHTFSGLDLALCRIAARRGLSSDVLDGLDWTGWGFKLT